MERAGRVIGKLSLSGHGHTDEKFAMAAWPGAVGKKIAARTSAVSLVRTRLVVEVEDAIWQRQLFTLREQILRRLEQISGRRIVHELEFRVAIPKRQPERALDSGISTDEADGIRNPVLRRIYIASRKKASA